MRYQLLDNQILLGSLRWLHSLDLRANSRTYGVGDREYWAWLTRDFGNGTWQGGLAGFLDALDLLDFSTGQVERVVEACLTGSKFLQRSNGSFEEAYPYESSYAVTGLVQFNLLYSYLCHREFFSERSKETLLAVTKKSNSFLTNTPETHCLISNHLVTSFLAEDLYQMVSGGAQNPAGESLQKIESLLNTSEGWFPEYGGADPGYQSLLNHYLVAFQKAAAVDFSNCLNFSRDFVENFLFPSGSFTGEVGSRGTLIVYPSGLSDLGLNWFIEKHVGSKEAVTPTNVDSGNFVPVFNSWSLTRKILVTKEALPTWQLPLGKKTLPKAGFIAINKPEACLRLSTRNGAFRKESFKNEEWVDGSVVAFRKRNWSTQLGVLSDYQEESGRISYTLSAGRRSQLLNNWFITATTRLIALIFYPFPGLQRLLKGLLVTATSSRGASQITDLKVSLDLTKIDLPITITGDFKSWKKQVYGFDTHMASANTFSRRSLN